MHNLAPQSQIPYQVRCNILRSCLCSRDANVILIWANGFIQLCTKLTTANTASSSFWAPDLCNCVVEVCVVLLHHFSQLSTGCTPTFNYNLILLYSTRIKNKPGCTSSSLDVFFTVVGLLKRNALKGIFTRDLKVSVGRMSLNNCFSILTPCDGLLLSAPAVSRSKWNRSRWCGTVKICLCTSGRW